MNNSEYDVDVMEDVLILVEYTRMRILLSKEC